MVHGITWVTCCDNKGYVIIAVPAVVQKQGFRSWKMENGEWKTQMRCGFPLLFTIHFSLFTAHRPLTTDFRPPGRCSCITLHPQAWDSTQTRNNRIIRQLQRYYCPSLGHFQHDLRLKMEIEREKWSMLGSRFFWFWALAFGRGTKNL